MTAPSDDTTAIESEIERDCREDFYPVSDGCYEDLEEAEHQTMLALEAWREQIAKAEQDAQQASWRANGTLPPFA